MQREFLPVQLIKKRFRFGGNNIGDSNGAGAGFALKGDKPDIHIDQPFTGHRVFRRDNTQRCHGAAGVRAERGDRRLCCR
ncbi:hypothetical protein [Morganella morganii]|uniref:hypothetical protein n=1 Tax=Morganella morganii TaxID=582 RepID=UPI00311981CB